MKTRNGFVSNSSSASFVIDKNYLTPLQVACIHLHSELAEKLGGYDCGEYDAWHVDDRIGFIHLSTDMDNFDMRHFLKNTLGIPDEAIVRELLRS